MAKKSDAKERVRGQREIKSVVDNGLCKYCRRRELVSIPGPCVIPRLGKRPCMLANTDRNRGAIANCMSAWSVR